MIPLTQSKWLDAPAADGWNAEAGQCAMHLIELLRNIVIYADISDADLQLIARDFRERKIEARQHLFHEGDIGNDLYVIKAGLVRIYVNSVDGSETSVVLFGRTGKVFGELALIDDLPRSANAVALEETHVYALSRNCFHSQIKRFPQMALNLMRLLSERVRYNTRQMDSLTSLDVSQRLAFKLLELAREYDAESAQGDRIVPTLRQTELASMIGTSRESINKVLRNFRGQGWISTEDGRIIILDEKALADKVDI